MDEIIDVRPAHPYALEFRLRSGRKALIDVRSKLWGKALAPLLDPERFMEGHFDEELGSIVWPNGADLSPEYVMEEALAALAGGDRAEV